jgi:hypothetical protein
MALSQLFGFDEYIKHFENFGLPGGLIFVHLLPCIIVITEVLAVPFLLRIHLSQLMRTVSMIFGWVAALIWLQLSLWLVFNPSGVSNIGILGIKVNLIPGWWAVFLSLALLIMSIWASWGLWPIPNNSRLSRKGRKS